jgi:hypothetical protein
MLQLVLSFDTEDYVTPEAVDAKKFWAEELSARGLRGGIVTGISWMKGSPL